MRLPTDSAFLGPSDRVPSLLISGDGPDLRRAVAKPIVEVVRYCIGPIRQCLSDTRHKRRSTPRYWLPQTSPDSVRERREIGEAVLHDILRDLEVHAAVAVDDDIPESRHSPHRRRELHRHSSAIFARRTRWDTAPAITMGFGVSDSGA